MTTSTRRIAAALVAMLVLAGAAPAQGAATPANVRVTRDGYAAHLEPALAVNPRDGRALLGGAYYTPAASSVGSGRLPGTFYSVDGGATWHDNGPLPLPPGYTDASNLSVAFTAHGVGWVVVRLESAPDHTAIAAWLTTDGGRHFGPPIMLAAGDAGHNLDHPWIAAALPGAPAAGSVVVAWSVTTSRRSEIAVLRCDEMGHRLGPPSVISGPAPQGDVAPLAAAGGRGQVAVVYPDTGAAGAATENATSFQQAQVRIAVSTDGGRHFGAPRALGKTTLGAVTARPLPWFGEPAVAMGPRDGTLYVAFVRAGGRATRPAIVLERSPDGERTWQPLVPVARTSPTAAMDQLQPQLAVAGDGAVALTYMVLDHGRADLYLAVSRDQGATFAAPQRITSRSWDPTLGLSVGQGQYWVGDYQALAAGPSAVYPCWGDTRSGRLELYAAAVPLQGTPAGAA